MNQVSFLLVVCAIALVAFSPIAQAQLVANARVYGTTNAPTAAGLVTFTQPDAASNVTLTYSFTGLTPNANLGFHVHAWGDLTSTDGASAGGHYNPGNVSHGCFPNPVRHAGDMGNITTDGTGAASGSMTLDLLQLSGEWSIVGHAVVIHAQGDNCQNPTGNAGARLAYGVIGIAATAGAGTGNQYNTTVLVATMHGTTGNEAVVGAVYFTTHANGNAQVYAQIYNLSASTVHGFHIHTYGDISTNDGLAAGGHFNPFNKTHNYPDSPERHVGDMGNVTADATGKVTVSQLFDLISLGGVNSIIGRAVILHANPDVGSSSPTNGNAGARVAIGVIGVTNAVFPVAPITPPGGGTTSAAAATVVSVNSLFLMMAVGLVTLFF